MKGNAIPAELPCTKCSSNMLSAPFDTQQPQYICDTTRYITTTSAYPTSSYVPVHQSTSKIKVVVVVPFKCSNPDCGYEEDVIFRHNDIE